MHITKFLLKTKKFGHAIKQVLGVLIVLGFVLPMAAQELPDFLKNEHAAWVDSVFSKLTLEEKVGQILMPRGNDSGRPHDVPKLEEYVTKYHVGGIVFFAGPPTVQAEITNRLQSLSKVPLMIGEDFEWGLAMRIDSADRYPYNMAIGAMEGNEDLIEAMGAEVGRQCKRLGVHVNYAPVVDVNVNPNNPVINFRSYGENKNLVARKALAYMKGLQSQNIIATAKHFPGHGDTDVDSHHDLPLILHDKKRLEEIEFFPFQTLVDGGLAGIMTSHLEVPSLDKRKGIAATFSPNILQNILRNEMGFQGLTFTDAMDMQGAVKSFPKGEAMVEAFLAGNDILETFRDVPLAVESLINAVKSGKIPMKVLDESVRKILMAKAWVGLNRYQPIPITGLVEDLNTRKSDYLNREMSEKFVTLVKNQGDIVPFRDMTKKIAVISSGGEHSPAFARMCANYTNVEIIEFSGMDTASAESFINGMNKYDLVIHALYLNSIRPASKYGITGVTNYFTSKLAEKNPSVLCVFGNVYALPLLEGLDKYQGIVMAYQNTSYTQEASAQALFGAIPFAGKLPVSTGSGYVSGAGLTTMPLGRMSYGLPEQVGLTAESIEHGIDSVMHLGLDVQAFPGGVVQVIKDGRTIFRKAYGFHTYEDATSAVGSIKKDYEAGVKSDAMDYFETNALENKLSTTSSDIKGLTKLDDVFDLASVTKVSAAALALMKMQTEGLFDEHKSFGSYVPSLKGSNKEQLIFKDLLTHRSGLRAWIPFWRNAVDTITTVELAMINNPSIKDSLAWKAQKRNFFDRLFGRKKALVLDYEATAKNARIWQKVLTPENITWKPGIFSHYETGDFTVKIHDHLYLSAKAREDVLEQIRTSATNPGQGYVYSDLHFYFYPEMIKHLTGKTFEDYIGATYASLGAHSLGFLPKQKFSEEQIIPTEYDSLFRKVQIHGEVHDEGAAMLGGISGHAGLFGNVNDLSKLYMMYLQYGTYGGQRYIGNGIVEKFTSYQFPEENNRRGLVFDKASLDKPGSNAPHDASPASFGHSGYTGPFVWVDPEKNFLYIVLLNRVYPTRNNTKVIDMNLRTGIGDVIYNALKP